MLYSKSCEHSPLECYCRNRRGCILCIWQYVTNFASTKRERHLSPLRLLCLLIVHFFGAVRSAWSFLESSQNISFAACTIIPQTFQKTKFLNYFVWKAVYRCNPDYKKWFPKNEKKKRDFFSFFKADWLLWKSIFFVWEITFLQIWEKLSKYIAFSVNWCKN